MSDWLEEIEERERAATPGPWLIEGRNHTLLSESGRMIGQIYQRGEHNSWIGTPQDLENMQFIANAREDIPRLIARVRELGADNERLQTLCGNLAKTGGKHAHEEARLRGRVAELEAQAARDATVRAAAANAIGHMDWGGFTNHVLDNLSDDWVLPVVEALYELEAVVAPLLEEADR